MNWKNLKIGTKLSIGFAIIILLGTTIGYVGYKGMNNYQDRVAKTEIANWTLKSILEIRTFEKSYMLNHDKEAITKSGKILQQVFEQIEESKQLFKDQKDIADLNALKQKAEKYSAGIDEYARIYKQAYMTSLMNSISEGEKTLAQADELIISQKTKLNLELKQQLSNQNIKNRTEKLEDANKILQIFAEARLASKAYVFTQQINDANEVLDKTDELLLHIKATKAKMTQQVNIDQLNAMSVAVANYQKSMKETIAAVNEQSKQTEILETTAVEFVALANDIKAGQETKMIAEQQRSESLILLFIIICVFIGVSMAYIITRSIVKGIVRSVDFATMVSEGDLTVKFDADILEQKDEVGMLAKALKTMVERLKNVVYEITSGADNIAEASQELSSTSQQLSQGASEQAASTEEVSSSMEEMASNIQQNTTNAQETEKISLGVDQSIQKVGSGAQESLSSIKDIAQKITIINDIAFQTNILALNAAVEAARAGEHGKGFAVVAAEVRKLAERSKIAADEIGILSKSSVEVTEVAGKLMSQLIPEIQKTSSLVREISAASLEQDSGADQINSAIQQLNNVTQQNAAASEEMATSSEEMASQADQLKEIISFFKVNNTTTKKHNSFKTNTHTKNSKPHLKQYTSSGVKLDLSNNEKLDNEFEQY
ncbi:MAG: HAMP domain-containing protein [Salinivirgaceae bacterium]|nr:HAMP domain-containing protein [Salinivirgaceae bacterium]